mmetsp:Transcript_1503/g.2011  ORF Transcript_1503/g.2011 Transcript_1503/m.2011 type:complete len:105 (+) Transcript_1503:185-499(+)
MLRIHPINTKTMPSTRHAVARAFLGCKKYEAVRPGPSVKILPSTKHKLPKRIKVLLKKSETPKMVKTPPTPNKGKPMLRLASIKGSLLLSEDEEELDGDRPLSS